jgi:hypothetical protein
LEWAKERMYVLHYDVIKLHFRSAARLLYTDTDSLIYHITLTAELLEHLELSDYDPDCLEVENLLSQCNRLFGPTFDLAIAGDNRHKGKVGFAKLEVGGHKQIIEYFGAQAKMYLLCMIYVKRFVDKKGNVFMPGDEGDERKAKGIASHIVKKFCNRDVYINAIFERMMPSLVHKFLQMRSNRHRVEHLAMTKTGVASHAFKVHTTGPTSSRPLGHFRNSRPEHANDDSEELWVRPE